MFGWPKFGFGYRKPISVHLSLWAQIWVWVWAKMPTKVISTALLTSGLFSTFERGGMPKVIKILVFLFTFTSTILGALLRQDPCLIICGSPNPQPIATARELSLLTPNVKGITTAMHKHLRALQHHRNQSLYLTRPNPDPPPQLMPNLAPLSHHSQIPSPNNPLGALILSCHQIPTLHRANPFFLTNCHQFLLHLSVTIPSKQKSHHFKFKKHRSYVTLQ
jgi:hypothetical protein